MEVTTFLWFIAAVFVLAFIDLCSDFWSRKP